MLDWCSRRVRSNALPLVFTATLVVLLAALFVTDRRLGLHEFASNRYQFHAVPVAVSILYHGRPHDYTADRTLAMRFQNTERKLDDHIRDAIHPDYELGGTYFWVADDRGLADYVIASFKLFGPTLRSLSKFYFLLLGLSLAMFVASYWHTPAVLAGPTLLLLGWLAIAQVLLYPAPFPNEQGMWAEQIALYESRMFDVLGLVAVLHLGVLAAGGPANRVTMFTAVLQAAVLIFLYHARSSLGWQYLALFTLSSAAIACWLVRRLRSPQRPLTDGLIRPLFVFGLLGFSLFGLKQYQQVTYHPAYLAHEHGRRTFWHNALMGLAYHPRLSRELPIPLVSDRDAANLVLARMVADDPNLDRIQWNADTALVSLGNHHTFNWNRYEATAQLIYFDLWRTRTGQMFACYAYYKPVAIAEQIGLLAWRVTGRVVHGLAWELVVGLVAACAALIALVCACRRDAAIRGSLSGLVVATATLIPFSLIPGISFYPAITTVACFHLLAGTTTGVLVVRVVSRRKETV